MRYLHLYITLLFFSLLFSEEESSIKGVILDYSNQKPITGANIYVEDSNTGTVSNELGAFSLSINNLKINEIKISMIGYRDTTLFINQNNIKNKYKNNPTVQQQKIAALFQEHKINPLAGCLPMLIQMPVLMSVFMVFRNTIEFRGESFVFWINDLSAADTLFFVGEIPFNVLPFLMSASMYYTMQAGMANQPSGGDPAQEATQKMMKYMFPGMMFFLFYSFPSGLNLYYLCFNVMQIAQQKIINKEA